jgi:hypothetical protein
MPGHYTESLFGRKQKVATEGTKGTKHAVAFVLFVPFVAILPLISYQPNETYNVVLVRRAGVLSGCIRSAAAGNGTVILSCSVRSVLRCLP